jgi:hypothetical protein
MARKKLTDSVKLERIEKALLNLVADICSNKASPELLGIAQSEIALCLAVIRSSVDDELVIGKAWAELEAKILQDRAVARGVVLGETYLQGVLETNDKPKSKNATK